MNTRRVLSRGWKIGLVVLIVLVVVYRLNFAPVPVEHSAVKTGPITEEVMGTGTLEARVQAIVSAKISGRLSAVLVDQGDRVTKGQPLAVLDDGDLRQQVGIARAEEAATKAGVERAAAEVVSAQAVAVHAQSVYARMAALAKQRVVTQQNLDDATQQRDVAEAQLRRAELAKIEVERQVVKAEASLRYSQEKLTDTQISAPFDGLIIRRDRDAGAVVVPGSSILQIISTDEMWVSAWVDESAMANLAAGQGARVVFRSEPDRSYHGTLARMSPLADRETREFQADVLVKELPKTWAVGQRAEVYIQTASRERVLLVPQVAMVWRKGKAGLFVSNGGRAKWKSVEPGLRGSDMVEIRSGLAADETVIWSNVGKDAALKEGRTVRLQ